MKISPLPFALRSFNPLIPKEGPLTCSGLTGYQCKRVIFGEAGIVVKNLTLLHLGSNFTCSTGSLAPIRKRVMYTLASLHLVFQVFREGGRVCTIKEGLFNEAKCHKNDIYNKAYQDSKLTTGKIQPF